MKHADVLDFANELQENEINNALANRVVYSGESLEECEECGEEIPLARREAVKGCKLCIGCQSRKERR